MSRHDPVMIFRQMRDFARQGTAFALQHARDDLVPDSLDTLGLIKLVEMIGALPAHTP